MVPSDLELGTPSPHTADTISPQCISGRVRLLIARPVRLRRPGSQNETPRTRLFRTIHLFRHPPCRRGTRRDSDTFSELHLQSVQCNRELSRKLFTEKLKHCQKFEVSPCCAIADFFDRSLTRPSIDNQRATATRSYPPIVKIEVVLFPKLFGALHLSPCSALAKCISTAEFAAWVPS